MYVNPPSYIQADARSREQFLSEIGNVTPAQREIFHALCKLWQSELSYKWFLGQTSGLVKNIAAELDRLMDHLSQKACGLIVHKFEDGVSTPDKIVLTPPNDVRYYYFRLLEELDAFAADPDRALPTEQAIAGKGLSLPSDVFRKLGAGELDEIFRAPWEDEPAAIFRLALAGTDALYLTAGSGTRFTNACLSKLRAAFAKPQFLAEVARVKGSSLAELKGRVESRDPLLWLDLIEAILTLRRDPARHKKAGSDEHEFQTAAALKEIIEYKIEDVRRKKAEQEERGKDYEALAMQVRSNSDMLVSAPLMNELLKTLDTKYVDKAAEVRIEFLERYTESRDKIRLPLIIQVSSQYIHQSNFYSFFLERYRGLVYALKEEYSRMLDQFLRRHRRDHIGVFYSRESFEEDMAGKIRLLDAFVADVLERPRLLAEALILHYREARGVRDIRDIRSELEKFFKPESMIYKNLSAIFGLSPADLFEQAFARLSFLRQIWLRLTGRYKLYREQIFGSRDKSGRVARASSAVLPVDAPLSADRLMKSSSTPARSGLPGVLTRAPRKPQKPAEPKPRPAYTRREQEQAWRDFNDTLRKQ